MSETKEERGVTRGFKEVQIPMSEENPTQILFGWGTFTRVRELIDQAGYRSITLLTGRFSLKESGHLNLIREDLAGHKVRLIKISPLPTLASVEQLLKQEGQRPLPDVIVAVGGGSVIDTAKCLAIMLLQENSLREILDRHSTLKPDAIPCLAVPTTAGTGSEVTSSATIWDMDNYRKRSLANKSMFPRWAILDPELTLTLPPQITAVTGLDAMAHAVEAAYSTRSTSRSDKHAFWSLRTIMGHLQDAVTDGNNREAREALLKASLEAGLAIAETSTAAAHSVSYPLTIHYGVPHGHAVGLLAPEFLLFNTKVTDHDCRDPRGVCFVIERSELIASTIGYGDVPETREQLRGMLTKVGLKTNLRALGVTDIGLIAEQSLDPDRASNHPRTVTKEAVKSILEAIWN